MELMGWKFYLVDIVLGGYKLSIKICIENCQTVTHREMFTINSL